MAGSGKAVSKFDKALGTLSKHKKTIAVTAAGGILASDVAFDTGITKKIGSTVGEAAGGAGAAVGEGVGGAAGGLFQGLFGDWWPFIVGFLILLFLYFFYLLMLPPAPPTNYSGGGKGLNGLFGASNRTMMIAVFFVAMFALCQTLAMRQSKQVKRQ